MDNIDVKIINIVRHAALNSPFYKNLYRSAGVDYKKVHNAADIAILPIVNPLDLIKHHKKFRAINEEIYRISSSSGTSLHPKTLFRTYEDTKKSSLVMCRLFEMAGIKRGDSMLIGQPFDLAHLGFITLEGCRILGVMGIPVGISVSDERILDLLIRYRPTSIFTSPSRMAKITTMFKDVQGKKFSEMRNILLAGERTFEGQRRKLREFWDIRPIDLYGSEETDGLGGSCSEHRGLHFMSDLFYMELVKPNTNKVVEHGEIGEAVITSLYSKGTPLIRYRLGDLIEYHHESCPCGRSWPLISVRGKTSDVLFLYDGIKLYAYQVENVLKNILPKMENFQLCCRTISPGVEEVTVVVKTKLRKKNNEIAEKIQRELWNCSIDLSASRSIGSLRFKVVLSTKSLFTTKRGKTPRILDLRKQHT